VKQAKNGHNYRVAGWWKDVSGVYTTLVIMPKFVYPTNIGILREFSLLPIH